MSFNMKLLVNCTSRLILKDFKRQIYKTSTAANSDAVSRKSTFKSSEKVPKEWIRLNKYNNIRAISTAHPITKELISDESEFIDCFPDFVRDLTEGRYFDIPEVNKRYAQSLKYNVMGGKYTRGLLVASAYKELEKPELLTSEKIRQANILGWCVEIVQGLFLVLDDVMDGSENRRGAPCWYKNKDVGIGAVNDGLLLECGIYSILKQHFSQHSRYVDLLELFHDVILKTALGQSIDFSSSLDRNLDEFTMDKYYTIVNYKTACYFFDLPLTIGIHLANFRDPEMHELAKSILFEMAFLWQAQNDILDCFGDQSLKIGTDIQEGKCSWLAAAALERTTPVQRKILDECYGKWDPVAVETVKNLYRELDLAKAFSIWEEEKYILIHSQIQLITRGLSHEFFFKLMRKIYRRNK